MKTAIDLDGTFMLEPIIYQTIMLAFKACGHEVGILTGRSGESEQDDLAILRRYGVEPSFFINTSQMNSYERDIERMILDDKINMDRDELCCMFKARICHEEKITLLYDDAADMIRMKQPKGCKTLMLKSPAPHNMVAKKWGKAHRVEYGENDHEKTTGEGLDSVVLSGIHGGL